MIRMPSALLALVLALTTSAGAHAQTAPSRVPRPPAAIRSDSIASVRAPVPPSPPPSVLAPARRAAVRQAASPAPVIVPLAQTGPRPDALPRSNVRAAEVPPANAVALCGDGTFAGADTAPCASHRGVQMRLPHDLAPKTPRPRVWAPPLRAVRQEASAPPSSATARCKDGTYLYGSLPTDACADRGGVAVRITQKSAPRRPLP